MVVVRKTESLPLSYPRSREEFDRIINFILEQKEKVVVCCDKVDRLSRNVFDKRIGLLYEKALNDELELHFTSEGQVINKDISAVEKFQFSMSLGLAKYYSDAIRDNVKHAQEQMLRKGIWVAKAPYGYKNILRGDGTKDIVIDKYDANIVKKFSNFMQQALGYEKNSKRPLLWKLTYFREANSASALALAKRVYFKFVACPPSLYGLRGFTPQGPELRRRVISLLVCP